jgi:hypothetical protein
MKERKRGDEGMGIEGKLGEREKGNESIINSGWKQEGERGGVIVKRTSPESRSNRNDPLPAPVARRR